MLMCMYPCVHVVGLGTRQGLGLGSLVKDDEISIHKIVPQFSHYCCFDFRDYNETTNKNSSLDVA